MRSCRVRAHCAGPLSLLQPLVAICSCLPLVSIRILRPGLGPVQQLEMNLQPSFVNTPT